MKLSVRLQPKASRSEIVGWENGALKVKVSAPPVGGAANDALIEILSKSFKVAKSKISLASGQSSRNKVIEIIGDSELEKRIRDYVRT